MPEDDMTQTKPVRRGVVRSLRAASAMAVTLLVGAALLLGAKASRAADLLEFNYGIPNANHATVFVAQDLGLFEKVGLKPKFFIFQSGAPLLASLKSESLDVVTAGLAVVFALGQNIPIKFIFWEANSAVSEGLVADPKSGIKSYKDIGKAKKIAAATGTCAQVSLYMMAKKVGMDYGKLDVVNIPAPLFRNSFISGSIDAGVAWPPFSLQLQSEGYPVVAYDEEYTPPGGLCPGLTGVRPNYLKQHPEIGLKLVQVEAMAREEIRKNPQVAIDAYIKRQQLAPAVAKATVERECCDRGIPSFAQQVDPKSPFSMTAKDGGLAEKLRIASEALHAMKAIPEPIPFTAIQDSVDPTYLQQYLKSMGK
jgi:NitT/TauT family transport system substrate-binding protein